jgi:hypothetical protein
MCDDPRLVAGGNVLGGYVTPNDATNQLKFIATAKRYKCGETINFSITAGPRFMKMDAPHGVFLAVQVSFQPSMDPSNPYRTGANGQAMGAFHDLSADLTMHPNCASTLFSNEFNASSRFAGTSSFSWTPSCHAWEASVLKTTGNATFSVLWANDPAGNGIENPYVYLKTIAIADHNGQSPTSSNANEPVHNAINAAGSMSGKACVVNTTIIAGHKHAYKASPVFVQALASGEMQTLAAGQCIACRRDAACKSARINGICRSRSCSEEKPKKWTPP